VGRLCFTIQWACKVWYKTAVTFNSYGDVAVLVRWTPLNSKSWSILSLPFSNWKVSIFVEEEICQARFSFCCQSRWCFERWKTDDKCWVAECTLDFPMLCTSKIVYSSIRTCAAFCSPAFQKAFNFMVGKQTSKQTKGKRITLASLLPCQVYISTLKYSYNFRSPQGVASRKMVFLIITADSYYYRYYIIIFPSNKHCPSARCANAVGKFLDIFTFRTVSLHLMQQLVPN
jgi:hypothetical protein